MAKLVKCKVCESEMAKSAKVCPSCGAKNKKPLYTRWWLWLIVVIVIVAAVSSGGEEKPSTGMESQTPKATEVITYEVHDLKTMMDDLKGNALKAETKYQDKYVEVTAKISNFDSDGDYIGVKPTNADEWDFDTAMCYIKTEEQKNILMEKNVGDTVTIKGKVKSIGEVLGYSIDIAEVQ